MNYAHIIDGRVVDVIVADADFIASQTNKTYILCTRGGIGYTYDADANVFIAPQPFGSWSLDDDYDWQPPTPMPSIKGKRYVWDEAALEWAELI